MKLWHNSSFNSQTCFRNIKLIGGREYKNSLFFLLDGLGKNLTFVSLFFFCFCFFSNIAP